MKDIEKTIETICETVLNDYEYLDCVFQEASNMELSIAPVFEPPVVVSTTEQLFKLCDEFNDRTRGMLYIDRVFKNTLMRTREEYLAELYDTDFSDKSAISRLNNFQRYHLGKMLEYKLNDQQTLN